MEIGMELMKRMYPQYQYVIATHIDREHIHNHIIVNAVNYETFRKLHSNKESLDEMRNISDRICKEQGLSVMSTNWKTHRERLRKAVDDAVKTANGFDEFLANMQAKGYEIKQGKYLAFKGIDDNSFMRMKSLGTAYSEQAVRTRIGNTENISNTKIHIYDDKAVKMSYRKRLRMNVDKALKSVDNFDDFLALMRSWNYEIKQGKHLAFRYATGKKFIRCDSLGDDYSEFMLRLFFDNPQEYKKLKDEIAEGKIGKLIKPQDEFVSRWQASHNVNVEIKMLNFLNENGIKNYNELLIKLADIQMQVDENENNIKRIDAQINEKEQLIKANRIKWQYSASYEKYMSLPTPSEKSAYHLKNFKVLQMYEQAIKLLDNEKLTDGSFPKTADLKTDIEELIKLKNPIEVRNQREKSELQKYENMKYNAENIVGMPTEIAENQKKKDIHYR
jgi:hypothetical protein